MPWVREPRKTRTVTLLVTGNPDDPYTLMIEPWGMTYELDGSRRMFVDIDLADGEFPELVAWPGGLSIYAAGRAVTRDTFGKVLHEF